MAIGRRNKLKVPAAISVRWTPERLAAEQATDPECLALKEYLSDNKIPTDSVLQSRISMIADHCQIIDDILYKVDIVRQRPFLRLLTPTSLRHDALHSAHEESGHPGRDRTKANLARTHSWRGMFTDADNWVKACIQCQQAKGAPKADSLPMQLRVPQDIHEVHYIDYVDGLPKTPDGNQHMLTVLDEFTKYLWAFPVVEANAKSAAQAYFEGVVCPHQAAKRLVMDNGAAFTGTLMKELAQLIKTQRVFTSAYHPQSNLVERAHRTLKETLRTLCTHQDLQKTWDRVLPIAVAAYNKSVHESTDESPYFLMHGRDPSSLFDLSIGQTQAAPTSLHQYTRDLTHRVAVARDWASATLKRVRTMKVASKCQSTRFRTLGR